MYDIGLARIGLMVCFDWFYPESVRTLALKGADIVAHPSNLVLPHCPDAMITRCLENRVFAVTCNRIGSEERGGKEKLSYIGTSEIVSPTGKILSGRGETKWSLESLTSILPKRATRRSIPTMISWPAVDPRTIPHSPSGQGFYHLTCASVD